MKSQKTKVAVLISGGVDSSVVLALLHQTQTYDLTAFYLKIWLEDETQFLGTCPWEDDLKYARSVCAQFNVPLEVIPLQTEYFEQVVSYTVQELKEGRTPSPDIFCNERIKFGAFYDAIGKNFDFIATGHYAVVNHRENSSRLKNATDEIKDQTYFLAHISAAQLRRCLFPLGGMLKSEVRKLAEGFALENSTRKDSQGICFLGKIKYSDFVAHYLGEKTGQIVDIVSQKQLGEHRGFWFHTVGQRKGLKLHGGPWFVVKKDIKTNTVYVTHESLLRDYSLTRFRVRSCHWINEFAAIEKLMVKVRHGKKMLEALISYTSNTELIVQTSEQDSGLADGQFCVFYDQGVCLGSGMIELFDI